MTRVRPVSALFAAALLMAPAAPSTRAGPDSHLMPFQAQAGHGPVRTSGRAVADAGGEFAALGASLFWAAWAYRHDRPLLDAHLRLLADHRFDYVRALGVVGRQPYWAGREIDWRWPDYDDVIAGLTDHAYDRYGLRIQWTILADGDEVIPDRDDRLALVDRFLKMSTGREHKIIHFEVANESWQNGFSGPAGVAQLRELAARLTAGTDIPVAVSDSAGHGCADHLAIYGGAGADILTEHFDRDVSGPLRSWRPVLQPWGIRDCAGLPSVVSNNEPIGPRSSVESETDPFRLVAAAVVSYLSGVGLYVFHTDAGVAGREPITAEANAAAILAGLQAMKGYVPPDVANWSHHRHDSPGQPFVVFSGERRERVRTDISEDGPVDVFVSTREDRLFGAAVGVINALALEARRPMALEVLHPLTGDVLQRAELKAGEVVSLRALPMVVLRGTFR